MKKLLGTLEICELPFKVYLADEKGEKSMKTCWAVCYPETQQIYIRSGMSKEMTRFYMVHEALHAIWQHAGIRDVLMGATKCRQEESFIRNITPHIVSLMRQIA
jgi:Zn-dependent peptidase ImmA (M78 family)